MMLSRDRCASCAKINMFPAREDHCNGSSKRCWPTGHALRNRWPLVSHHIDIP